MDFVQYKNASLQSIFLSYNSQSNLSQDSWFRVNEMQKQTLLAKLKYEGDILLPWNNDAHRIKISLALIHILDQKVIYMHY